MSIRFELVRLSSVWHLHLLVLQIIAVIHQFLLGLYILEWPDPLFLLLAFMIFPPLVASPSIPILLALSNAILFYWSLFIFAILLIFMTLSSAYTINWANHFSYSW